MSVFCRSVCLSFSPSFRLVDIQLNLYGNEIFFSSLNTVTEDSSLEEAACPANNTKWQHYGNDGNILHKTVSI